MQRQFRKNILTLVFCLFVGSVFGQKSNNKDTLRVLFVGNSYTYFWNLPQMVETMARSNDFAMIARKSTAGGTNWKQHWEGDKGLKSRSIIEDGNWDVVVLQNHSKSTINDLPQFMEYGDKLIELVKSTGARPVLYETWARSFNPLMIDQIKSGYHELAEKHKLDVVHVGEIWALALDQRADLRLYDPDDSHPSTIGTYLTSCAFYSYLTGKSAHGLEERISKTDGDGELLYLSIMSENDAEFMQDVVDHFQTGGK
jgi:hypothetical protein